MGRCPLWFIHATWHRNFGHVASCCSVRARCYSVRARRLRRHLTAGNKIFLISLKTETSSAPNLSIFDTTMRVPAELQRMTMSSKPAPTPSRWGLPDFKTASPTHARPCLVHLLFINDCSLHFPLFRGAAVAHGAVLPRPCFLSLQHPRRITSTHMLLRAQVPIGLSQSDSIHKI